MHPTRIFKEPKDLNKAFEEYKNHLKELSNDWVKVQYVGKDGDRVEEPQKVPMSKDGFEVFCYKKYGCVEQYFKNQDGYYDDFIPICSYISKEIRDNQITGGLLGFYNPSITQRLNNLKEQTENVNSTNVSILTIDPLDDSVNNITSENSRTKETD